MSAIYDTYSDEAYALAYRLLPDPGGAEDVVRDSFLELWRGANELDAAEGLRSPLLALVRRRAGERLQPAADPKLHIVSDEDHAEDRAAFLDDDVRNALDSLPSDQRKALQATYFSGRSVTEAAERLGVSAGLLKVQLRLALENIGQQVRT